MIEGKVNAIASLIIGILSTLAQHELERLKERQREGIARAKDRRVYSSHGGNRKEETREEFLSKSDTKKIIKYLNEGNSLRRSALLSKASLGKVQKVARVLEDMEKDKVKINNKIVTQLISNRANAIDMTKISMREWLYLPKNLHLHESDEAREKFLKEEEANRKIGQELEAQRKANL